MAYINGTIELTFCLQQAIISGQGLKVGVTKYLHRTSTDDRLAAAVVKMLSERQNGKRNARDPKLSRHQVALLELFRRGLDGESIGVQLGLLREEIEVSLHREVERHVCLVPFWSFLPLVVFQLPALILIAVYPLLYELLQRLSSA